VNIDLIVKIIKLVLAIISIWKNGGGEAARRVIAESNKAICDEQCELELKREVQGTK
jgi:hypothetical protein